MKIFVDLIKVDPEKRLVYGYASTEALDSQGERVTKKALEAALPDYMRFANLREMHQPSAVGVALEANLDDKGLHLIGKVVDDAAWVKVKEEVYKGFSLGGQVLTRVGNEITALKLTEISLVDRPANPEAVFDLWKAEDKPEGDYGSKTDAGYADPGLQADKKPRYPLKENGEWSEERIRAAWNYINKEKNAAQYSAEDLQTIKDRIIAAWKEHIDSEGPPSASEKLAKRMNDVSRLASLLGEFRCLLAAVIAEARAEADDSEVPGKLQTALATLVEIFKEFALEEADELLRPQLDYILAGETVSLAVARGDLAKAGARHTKEEMSQIQQIHDHAMALGAMCQGAEKMEKIEATELQKLEEAQGQIAKLEGDLKEWDGRLAKLEGEKADLEKRVKELEAEPAAVKGNLKAVGKGDDVTALQKIDGPSEAELLEKKDTLGLVKRAHQKPKTIKY